MHPDHQNDDRRITYFATTHTRGKREMFGIRAIDRGKHMYVIGKTGMGKSTLLENLAIQDIQNGEGIAFIDPHGSTAEKLLDFVPQNRIKDVVYFAPFDTDFPVGFNVMEDVGYDKRHLVVSGLMGALKRIWVDAWSARMEYILQNTLLALLEYPDSTLLDVNRMLTNKTFRNAVIEKITDPIVRAFWVEEFAGFTDTYTREATPAIQNKIGQFTANPLIRNIVGQAHSSFNLRKIMDEKKIFIVNLSKGRMGETNASLLGSMLTVKIYLAAMSRADEPPARIARMPRCYFYVDEFQSMMNEAFADILSEARKYKLALTLANQYIEQMEEEVRDAVFGNVGTLIVFRVGPFDAEVLKTVFEPTFHPEDLVGLGIGQIYLTLMIDGVGSAPFSAETIPPIEAPAISYRDDAVQNSRELYGRARGEVEQAIHKRQSDFVPPPPQKRERGPMRPGAWDSGAPRSFDGNGSYAGAGNGGNGAFRNGNQMYGANGNVNNSGNAAHVNPSKYQPRSEPPRNEYAQHAARSAPAPAPQPRQDDRERPPLHPVGPPHLPPQALRREHFTAQNSAPGAQSAREARQDEHRESLRAAIERARREAVAGAPAASGTASSPIDVLRAKQAQKGERSERAAHQPPRPQNTPEPRAQPQGESRPPHPTRAMHGGKPAEETGEKPERPPHHRDLRDGEVPPHVLQQILNGESRDTDDL